MSLPSIAAARRFDPAAHLPFFIGAERVGWVRRGDALLLQRWPDVFDIDASSIRLSDAYDHVDTRSAALGAVIGMLAADGRIPGWRDETYAVRNDFDAPPLAFIERAASRFFGTMTYAAHLNGIVEYEDRAPQVWIARRSHTKATDPGMLDNIVAGGIGWGMGIEATLAKECWEEAGMSADLAARATRGGTFHVLQSLPEGTQAEQIFVFDVTLPADFAPRNQDGEVGEHRLARIDEVARWIEEGALTVDASLATLDCLLRRRWIDEEACEGIATIYESPAP
jgi:8-oxo-dGTP pyrophosphatase MutT (NUDIX family)